MPSNFDACLAVTLKYEGGLSDNRYDPGGRTMRGVTQRVYDVYRERKGLATRDVYLIGTSEYNAIYFEQYFAPVHGDDLPAGLDLAIFDMAVNSGVSRAVMALQNAAGETPDGHFGMLTEAAVHAHAETTIALIMSVCARRLSFLERLKTWKFFGAGWKARVLGVRKAALLMATAKVATTIGAPV